jgi:sterol desaturase/sphingolipid hydroxylase (fatty acid hydroxylase superfamily)
VLSNLLSTIWGNFAAYLFGAALCTVAEMAFAGEKQSFASRLRGVAFTALSLAAAVIASRFARELMRNAGLTPLLQLDLSTTVQSGNPLILLLGYTVVPLLSVFIYDVGYYFFHRLQHSVPFLWRFHAVHHSIEELNAFNAYHHVSEYFLRIPLLTIPINLLVWVGSEHIIIAGAVLSVVGKLSHSNTNLGFGPLRYLFTEPRYHRVHHSRDERHWNRNFAFYFPVLDLLFRTSYFPDKSEYPATGLSYVREPRNLWQYLFPPRPRAAHLVTASATAQAPGSAEPA